MPITADERLLVVAPHPDDEALAAGGLLARARRVGARAGVAVFTLGDGWLPALQMVPEYAAGAPVGPEDMQAFGRLRAAELRVAVGRLGLGARDLHVLGFPDGGLQKMWERHWTLPFRAPTTGAASSPYRPDTPHTGAALARRLARLVAEFRPTTVVLPLPSDAHSDHRAAAAFTGLALLAAGLRPRLYAYVIHDPALEPDERLPAATRGESPFAARVELVLDADELERKREAVVAHRSQLRRLGDRMRRRVQERETFIVLPSACARGGERSALLGGEGQGTPDVDARLTPEALDLWVHVPVEGPFAIELCRAQRGDTGRRTHTRVAVDAGCRVDGDDGAEAWREERWVRVRLPRRPELSAGVLVAASTADGRVATGWRLFAAED